MNHARRDGEMKVRIWFCLMLRPAEKRIWWHVMSWSINRTEQLDYGDLLLRFHRKCLVPLLNSGVRPVGSWEYRTQIALLPFAWYDDV